MTFLRLRINHQKTCPLFSRNWNKDPRHHNNIKRLSAKLIGLSHYRLGDWRVMYRIRDEVRQLHVLAIANRRDVYE